MKWVVLGYLIVLLIIDSFLFYFKRKEKILYEKICILFFVFLNLFFLGWTFVSYQENDRNRDNLQYENNNLLLTKRFVENKNQALLSMQSDELYNALDLIVEDIVQLEQNKKDWLEEISFLEEQYNAQKNVNVSHDEVLFQVANFPTFDQRKNFPNGCESVSLYLLLKYYGVDVSVDMIVDTLKKGEEVHVEDGITYGGDPEIEFVGDPRSNTKSYGVYENPIIAVANQYKSGIKKATGSSLDTLLQIVESGIPVQVWASSYQRTPIKCNTWIHKESGKEITWYCNFHSMVLIGATSNKVIVSDPLTGTHVKYDRKKFEYAYDFYGRRAIYYE